MKKLPGTVKPYKRTSTFTQETVPKALLNDHNTKRNVWGVLIIESGSLTYVISEPGFEEEINITPGTLAVIAPEEWHFVRLSGEVKFFVEFYK
jgi:tellurite resistance-related uncharacterized protein